MTAGAQWWAAAVRRTTITRPQGLVAAGQRRRLISTQEARRLLGLSSSSSSSRGPDTALTLVEVRVAYFAAAKRCHPDTQSQAAATATADDFLQVTTAYKVLSQTLSPYADQNNNDGSPSCVMMSADQEADFRAACEQRLGVSAEIVEECKRSPLFLQWLAGRSDSAHTWRSFFTQHGGLAPQLPHVSGVLEAGVVATPRLKARRKRR
jgi:hypothetical protein